MSLANCRDCGKEISTNAKQCPHCGVRIGIPGVAKFFIGIGLLLVAFVVLAAIGSATKPSDASKPDPLDLMSAENRESSPDLIPALQSLIKFSGYECPAISAAWNKGPSPLGPKVEILCGPDDGSGGSYTKLHYAVYLKVAKVDVCEEFTAFGSECS